MDISSDHEIQPEPENGETIQNLASDSDSSEIDDRVRRDRRQANIESSQSQQVSEGSDCDSSQGL